MPISNIVFVSKNPLYNAMSLKLLGIVVGIVIIVFVMSPLERHLMHPQIAKGLAAKNWVSTWVESNRNSTY